MEKRPTEQKWIDVANGEIRTLGSDAPGAP